MEKIMDAYVVLRGDKYEGADIVGVRLTLVDAQALVAAQKPRHEARPWKLDKYQEHKWVAGHEVLYIETHKIPDDTLSKFTGGISVEGTVGHGG
jgi:hypothetical protein